MNLLFRINQDNLLQNKGNQEVHLFFKIRFDIFELLFDN